MPTPPEYSAPPSLAELRASIGSSSLAPARDREDFERVSALARQSIETGDIPARVSELRVRLAGPGITGHEMPVHHATQILDLIQGAVTALGAASRKAEKSKTPKGSKGKRVGTREATELRIGPYAAPGSLVFTLRASPLASSEVTLKGTEKTDAFVDVALKKLMILLTSAESDGADSIGILTSDIGRHGAMVASKLSQLAESTLAAELSLDLGHWSVGGSRHSSKLSSRGAAAIVAAAKRNKTRTEYDTIIGRLRTVSDGQDKLRLTLDDNKDIQMRVAPEIGVSLGSLLGARVEAEVDNEITWNLASGREKSTLTLRSMRAAPPIDRLDFGMPGD